MSDAPLTQSSLPVRRAAATTASDGVVAGAVAGVVGGLPSTLHALLFTRRPLRAALAAGSLLLPSEKRALPLLAAAVPVHAGVSLGWGVVLAAALPARATILSGAIAGVVIALVDLGIVGRRFPRVRALPALPQIADHVAFGAVAAAVVRRRREARARVGHMPATTPP